MTSNNLLANATTVFLDFDGPVCSIFGGFSADKVADQLKEALRQWDAIDHKSLNSETDPLQILHAIERDKSKEVLQAEELLTRLEVLAVESAVPALHLNEVLDACKVTRREVFIVSNNSASAVHKYLALQGLTDGISGVVGRDPIPSLMKPSPHLVNKALTVAHAIADEAIFIGDSTTDVEAAHAANVACIGYANKPGKLQRLTEAGADAVVTSMSEIEQMVLRQMD
ncbi:MAG TPA: HAD hydrolase-like protein [Mycobacteriales bacterium]|jgi:phosphoglycolate phosphatase|nr:HAD hydrolase-like protein [Mycobacteriales bacterium]